MIRPAAWKGCFTLDQVTMLRWCSILLVQEILVFAFLIAGTHGLIVKLDRPLTTDFVSFYAAGELADAGTAPLAYQQSAHAAAEIAATQPGVGYVYFFYPPIFLLLCGLFARLPYLASFLAFNAITLGLFVLALRFVLQPQNRAIWLIPILCFPACFAALGMGQNAFLTAALFAGATVALNRRPLLAGLLFGLICYKPHFGLLIPIVLLAGGYWRCFAAASLTVLLLVGVSIAVFGWPTWQAYLTAVWASGAVYQTGLIPFGTFVTPFGAARLLGLAPAASRILQVCVSLGVAAIAAWIWHRDRAMPTRAASLIGATLLAVPLALSYDLVLALVGLAWLAADTEKSPMPLWEKHSFIAIYVIALIVCGAGPRLTIPLGPGIGCLILAISIARSLRHTRHTFPNAIQSPEHGLVRRDDFRIASTKTL